MHWLTTFLTVTAGVSVFIIGQIFIEFFLKPLQKYKQLKADTAFCLRFYRAKFTNGSKDDDAQDEAQKLAAKLVAYSQEKPRWLYWVTQDDLQKCWEGLTSLSYCVNGTQERKKSAETGIEMERKIVNALNLRGF